MRAPTDLHAEIAVRLFGWRWDAAVQLWRDPDGVYRSAAEFRRRLKAYTTDPAATALVWQWVETRGMPVLAVEYAYGDEAITCGLVYARYQPEGTGATWPEALCRAALALAEALDSPRTRH